MADTHEQTANTRDRTDDGYHAKEEASPAAQQTINEAENCSATLHRDLERYAVDFASNENIRLDVSHRNVKMPLLSTICEYVALLNTPLVSLSLSRNALGPAGAMILGNALVTNNTLHTLELDDCELIGSAYRPQHDGIKSLAKGFESVRSTLRIVNLANNSLQPEGCRIVLGALSFHKTLTTLDLSANLLNVFNETEGVLALTYMIRYAKQLSSLTIDDNPLSPSIWKILHDSLASSTTLTSFSALRCNIPLEHLPLQLQQQPN